MVTITRVKYKDGKAVSVTKAKTSTSFKSYKKKSSSSKKAEIESAVGSLDKPETTPEKKTVVVGIGKDETTGGNVVENVGQNLTQQQRQEISSYTSKYGRLSSSINTETGAVTFSTTSTTKSKPAGEVSPPSSPATSYAPGVPASVQQFLAEKRIQEAAAINKDFNPRTINPATINQNNLVGQSTSTNKGINWVGSDQSEQSLNRFNKNQDWKYKGVNKKLGVYIQPPKPRVYATPESEKGTAYQRAITDLKPFSRNVVMVRDTKTGEFRRKTPVETAKTVGLAVTEPAIGFAQGAYGLARGLTVDLPETTLGVANLAVSKEFRRKAINQAGNYYTGTDSTVGRGLGRLSFDVAGLKLGGAAIRTVRSGGLRAVGRATPAENIFSRSALAKETKFPLAGSTAESIRAFQQADDFVVTASPKPISGSEVGIGGKTSQLGLQDTGLYTTPLGSGSPEFLKLSPTSSVYTFSPKKAFSSFLDNFKSPTATVIKTEGVSYLPRRVITEPGFSSVKTFAQETGGATGKVFITKRSMLGQGEIPRQQFLNNKGKFILEKGTTELEGVLPTTTKLKRLSGSEFASKYPNTPITRSRYSYTVVDGKTVRVRFKETVPSSSTFTPRTQSSVQRFLTKQGEKLSSYTSGGQVRYSNPYRIPSSGFSSSSVSSKTPITSSTTLLSSTTPIVSSTSLTPSSSSSSTSSFSKTYYPSVSTSSSPLSSSSSSSSGGSSSSSLLSSGFTSSSPSIPSYSGGSSSSGSSSSSSSIFSRGFSSSRTDYYFTPPTPTIKVFPPPKKKKKKEEFLIQVRKKGIFKTIGQTSNLLKAFTKGKFEVGSTSAASFRIKTSGGKIVTKPVIDNRYRASDREKGVFIQKRRFRISSAGEKRDITYKGLRSQQRKNRGFKI